MKTLKIAAVVCTIAAVSCSQKHEQSQQIPTVSTALPVVDSVMVHHTYPGVLTADKEVALVARVNGYLTGQYYESGSFVKKGQVLFTIEDRNYRDAVERARSQVNTAEASYNYAQTRYQALSEALKSDAVSRMEVEQGRSTLEEAEAALASARATLQTAQTQLSYCTVTAPFDGHMSSNVYSIGSYVGGEGSPVVLATIYDDKSLTANFSIDDGGALTHLLDNLEAGHINYNAIPVNFSDTLAHQYTAHLSYMSPKVNTSTGTLEIQAKIANPYDELRTGMYVSVDLPTAYLPQAILIRDAAISTDQLGKYIYVVNDSDKVVYTPIEVGQAVNDTMRVVTKGISRNDRYVTKALLKVRDGVTVNPVSEH